MKPKIHSDPYDHKAQAEWAASHGLKKSKTRCPVPVRARGSCIIVMPCCDHGELYTKSGRKACFVSQPYSIDDRDGLERFAKTHRMRLEIHPPERSWYYPGSTWLVILWYPHQSSDIETRP